MENNNKFFAGLVNYLNEHYTHDTKRHFRILTAEEMEKYSDALNNSDDEYYQPYATDGKNIVSVYDTYDHCTDLLFTYISSIKEGR